jgi:hypothetical protein
MNDVVILSEAGALFAPAQSKDLRLRFFHALTYTRNFRHYGQTYMSMRPS